MRDLVARHAAGGFPGGARYLGLDPKSRYLGDLDKALAALENIRPYIRKFHSSQYINDLADGDLCVALGYSGDWCRPATGRGKPATPSRSGFAYQRKEG